MERLPEEVGKKNKKEREKYILFPLYPYQACSYSKPENIWNKKLVPVFLPENNVAYEQFLQENTCPYSLVVPLFSLALHS